MRRVLMGDHALHQTGKPTAPDIPASAHSMRLHQSGNHMPNSGSGHGDTERLGPQSSLAGEAGVAGAVSRRLEQQRHSPSPGPRGQVKVLGNVSSGICASSGQWPCGPNLGCTTDRFLPVQPQAWPVAFPQTPSDPISCLCYSMSKLEKKMGSQCWHQETSLGSSSREQTLHELTALTHSPTARSQSALTLPHSENGL